LATVPGTELAEIATVALCGEPLYVCGELLTARVAVGVALSMVKFAGRQRGQRGVVGRVGRHKSAVTA
jgi:hypothetical protein